MKREVRKETEGESASMAPRTKRMLDQYLAVRGAIEHVTVEFLLAFADGSWDVLARVARGLRRVSPGHADLPMLHFAINELKRSAAQSNARSGPGKGRKPTVMVPMTDVPPEVLTKIRASNFSPRTKEDTTNTLRAILGAARRAGLPEIFSKESLAAFRSELDGRSLSAQTIGIQMEACARIATLCGLDLQTLAQISNERKAAKLQAAKAPSLRYTTFRAAPLTALDYARAARVASEEAFSCTGSQQSVHMLFLTAAALALFSFIPERVSDILKLVVGVNVIRDTRGWSSEYFSSKTKEDRSVAYLPDQLTPYLDDLMLLGADPGLHGRNLLHLYQHRVSLGSPLFARTDLRRPYSGTRVFEWMQMRTGHGPHAARKAMTDYQVDIGGTREEIMDLLGHRRAATSDKHYEVRAKAIRRKRTAEAIGQLRARLVESEKLRLPSGRLIDFAKINRDLDRQL